jgi:hypothetical protein
MVIKTKSTRTRWLTGAMVAAIIVFAWRADADAPAGRYALASGTVVDTKTGLIWQQTMAANSYTQSDAASYCATLSLNGGGWRLPSIKELLTLVDETKLARTFDETAFPGSDGYFWSSSPYLGDNTVGYFWVLWSASGGSHTSKATSLERARCVR